jgi:chitinase
MLTTAYMIAATMASTATAAHRFAAYYDEWHPNLPTKDTTAGITHVYISFADPAVFNTDPLGWYAPFQDPGTLRASFDDGTKMCLAIGGWANSAGYANAHKTDATRALFAKNVAAVLDAKGFECVGAYIGRRDFCLFFSRGL